MKKKRKKKNEEEEKKCCWSESVNKKERKKEKERRRKRCAGCDLSLAVGLMNVCSITKMPLETEFWKAENTQNVFSVSITHHSKIRELSNRNKN